MGSHLQKNKKVKDGEREKKKKHTERTTHATVGLERREKKMSERI